MIALVLSPLTNYNSAVVTHEHSTDPEVLCPSDCQGCHRRKQKFLKVLGSDRYGIENKFCTNEKCRFGVRWYMIAPQYEGDTGWVLKTTVDVLKLKVDKSGYYL